MFTDETIDEWEHLNSALLEAVRISAFISATSSQDNQLDITRFLKMDAIGNLLLFFLNFSREYSITHLVKIIDKDNQAITIYSFVGGILETHTQQDMMKKSYREWKKVTRDFSSKLLNARNRFSSHTDRKSFHDGEYFGLYIEDCDDFLKNTFVLFDVLYDNDAELMKSFNERIGKGKPSELAEIKRKNMQEMMENIVKSRVG